MAYIVPQPKNAIKVMTTLPLFKINLTADTEVIDWLLNKQVLTGNELLDAIKPVPPELLDLLPINNKIVLSILAIWDYHRSEKGGGQELALSSIFMRLSPSLIKGVDKEDRLWCIDQARVAIDYYKRFGVTDDLGWRLANHGFVSFSKPVRTASGLECVGTGVSAKIMAGVLAKHFNKQTMKLECEDMKGGSTVSTMRCGKLTHKTLTKASQ